MSDLKDIKEKQDLITDAMKTGFKDLGARVYNIEKKNTVTIRNSDAREIHISDLTVELYNDMKEVRKAVQPITDFQKLHEILKKYKIYWIIGTLLSLWMGWVGLK